MSQIVNGLDTSFKLNFIDRDTLLAALKDLIRIKIDLYEKEENYLYKAQANCVQSILDKLTKQKEEQWRDYLNYCQENDVLPF